jgi:hypothetical protein
MRIQITQLCPTDAAQRKPTTQKQLQYGSKYCQPPNGTKITYFFWGNNPMNPSHSGILHYYPLYLEK